MSVSVGAKSELEIALEGGPDFIERVRELNNAKRDAVKAQADLGLAQDAATALAAAAKMKEAAETTLLHAQKKAAEIQAASEQRAAQIARDLDAYRKEAESQATEARKAAEDYFSNVRAEIDEMLAAAGRDREQAARDLNGAKVLADRSVEAEEKAHEAEEASIKTRKLYETKLARLRELLKEMQDDDR